MELNILDQYGDESLPALTKDYQNIMKLTLTLTNRDLDSAASVIFVDDKFIHDMNRTYRGIDRPTDVISFAINDNPDDFEIDNSNELGDIFISLDTLLRQAQEYGHSKEREANFLFVHGLLHLLGFDHISEEDESIMFKLQDDVLDVLKNEKNS